MGSVNFQKNSSRCRGVANVCADLMAVTRDIVSGQVDYQSMWNLDCSNALHIP
jgi:hypothetical protein